MAMTHWTPWIRNVFLLVFFAFLFSAIAKHLYETNPRSGELSKQLVALQRNCDDIAPKAWAAMIRVVSIADISGLSNATTALEVVQSAKAQMHDAKKAVDPFVHFLTINREELKSEGLHGYVTISEVFGMTYRSLEEASFAYLDSYQALLEYAITNYAALDSGETSAIEKFEELEFKLYKAYDNRMITIEQHQEFLLSFAERNPEFASGLNQTLGKLHEMEGHQGH